MNKEALGMLYTYSLAARTPKTSHAYGATLGQQHLRPLLKELGSGAGETVVIDFDGIETATSSYLKAVVVAVFLMAESAASDFGSTPPAQDAPPPLNVFPAVAGLSDDIREELRDVLSLRKIPLMEALSWKSGDRLLRRARLLGSFDPALRESVSRLAEVGHAASAGELASRSKFGETAWNNRLAQLYRLRLARRTKDGRQWLFELTAREVEIDG